MNRANTNGVLRCLWEEKPAQCYATEVHVQEYRTICD